MLWRARKREDACDGMMKGEDDQDQGLKGLASSLLCILLQHIKCKNVDRIFGTLFLVLVDSPDDS